MPLTESFLPPQSRLYRTFEPSPSSPLWEPTGVSRGLVCLHVRLLQADVKEHAAWCAMITFGPFYQHTGFCSSGIQTREIRLRTSRVHKNKSMQRLISSLWGTGTAKFQLTWLLRILQKGVSMIDWLMYILRIAQQELNPDRGALLKHEKKHKNSFRWWESKINK